MKFGRIWLAALVMAGMVLSLTAPVFALDISFTTAQDPNNHEVGPYICGSTPALNAANVSVAPATFNVRFSGEPDSWGAIQLKRASDGAVLASGSYETAMSNIDPVSLSQTYRVDLGSPTLDAGTDYYIAFPALPMSGRGDQGTMDPLNSHNATYWDAPHSEFRIPFTTAATLAVSSTNAGGVSGGSTGGQSNVPINAVIKVTMNSALDGTTLTTANVVLHKGDSSGSTVEAAVGLDPADATSKTLMVTPAANLLYATTYTLSLHNVANTGGSVIP